jgi:hypothetical protein
MVDVANWESVLANGLCSAAELIRASVSDEKAREVICAHRGDTLVLPNGNRLRDQVPMPPSSLVKCLDTGLTPADWYALMNSKIFFWSSVERLNRHRAACAAREQMVLVLDFQRVVGSYSARLQVTPINTGFAQRQAARRGLRSFVNWERWVTHRWADEAVVGEPMRSPRHPIVEITIQNQMSDVVALLDDVTRLLPGKELQN